MRVSHPAPSDKTSPVSGKASPAIEKAPLTSEKASPVSGKAPAASEKAGKP